MSWTKRQIVEEAHEEIGLGSYAYNAQPEDLQFALRRLDAMMASWATEGVRVGYPAHSSPSTSSLDDDSNLPMDAVDPVVCGLAMQIAPSFGRTASPDTKGRMKNGKKALIRKGAFIPERKYDPQAVPRGAGWKTTDDIMLASQDAHEVLPDD